MEKNKIWIVVVCIVSIIGSIIRIIQKSSLQAANYILLITSCAMLVILIVDYIKNKKNGKNNGDDKKNENKSE